MKLILEHIISISGMKCEKINVLLNYKIKFFYLENFKKSVKWNSLNILFSYQKEKRKLEHYWKLN